MLDALLQDENLLELKRAKAQSKPKKIAVGSTCPICDNKVIHYRVLTTVLQKMQKKILSNCPMYSVQKVLRTESKGSNSLTESLKPKVCMCHG